MNALLIALEVLELANVAVWITGFTEQGNRNIPREASPGPGCDSATVFWSQWFIRSHFDPKQRSTLIEVHCLFSLP